MAAQIPTEDEVLGYFDKLSNWGRWGPDDELGTPNLITPDEDEARPRHRPGRRQRLAGPRNHLGRRRRRTQPARPLHARKRRRLGQRR